MYVGRLLELSGTSSKSVSSAENTTTLCNLRVRVQGKSFKVYVLQPDYNKLRKQFISLNKKFNLELEPG